MPVPKLFSSCLAFMLLSLPALLVTAQAPNQDAAADDRPNIVFLFADDLGRYASAYREPDRPTINDVIQTPHFDALAADGVLFWDAHVSAPSCSPCRGAVLTGRHFYRNGNNSQLHNPWVQTPGVPNPMDHIESYHQILDRMGYLTGVTYKTHVPMHLFVDASHGCQPAGGRFNTFSHRVMKGNTPEQRMEIQLGLFDEVRKNFKAFLDRREAGQPFCWYFSPTNPHRTWAWESAQAIWGLNPDDLQGRMPAFLPDLPLIRQDMADYLGEAMAFDRAVGVIVEHLKEIGEFDNTIIVVSGDHGAPGFPRGKCNLYNFGTQVPLLIHWPDGIANPGRRIDNPTSLIDLAPTYLEAVGLPASPAMNGRSLMPLLTDGSASGLTQAGNDFVITGRERHVFNARPGDLPYSSRALRTASYLYIRNFTQDRWPMLKPPLTNGLGTHGDFDGGPTKAFYAEQQENPAFAGFVDFALGKRPAEELYDLQADPDQMNNLVDNPDHATTLSAMREKLMTVLEQTGDPRVVGLGDAFDRPPYLKLGGR
ncbi:MAG: sulfatase [Planctomycetota bacterium]